MVDILHRIGVEAATPEKVYEALTTVEGLAGWWTEDVKGSSGVGDTLAFRFPQGGFDMDVVDARPAERVTWRVVDGPQEWIGTTIDWRLHRADDWTIVLFAHEGWVEPVEFMHHCSTKWATFLVSLKALLETGAGSPSPRDLPISDWH
ncbi:SRPBCC family protein [Actinomycetospora atypica]|uniref:SRPBCC domain-containing protein n=1 Tax=Actinomycetospora atypica TaxID=1290095 RepID=A0ABV9YPI8_9PSEU